MPSARIYLPPGAYTGVGVTGGTVPTLSAGTLSTAGPINVGASVTYTPSHALSALSTYQWRRNGVDIAGATSATYTAVSADAGTTLTCRESLGDKQTPVVSSGCTVSSAISRAFLRRVAVTSVSTSTATFTGVDITGGSGAKILVEVFGRTSQSNASVTLAVNGGSAVSMVTGNANLYRLGFLLIDRPAGSTMDLTATIPSGSWFSGEVWVALYDVSGGSITASGFDNKSIQTTDTTYSATVNVPAGAAIFAVQWPRVTDNITVTQALSNVDTDEATNSGISGNHRILASRANLSANASYTVSAILRRTSSTDMVFGVCVVSL